MRADAPDEDLHGERLRAAARLSPARRLGFLARDSMFYGVATAAHKAFALLTLPILARHFTVEAYGRIDLFNVATLFLAALVVFGQDSAVARHLYEQEGQRQRRQLVSQSLLVQLAASAVAVVALLLAAQTVVPRTGLDPVLVRLVILQLPFLVLTNFSQGILKWTFARGRFATVTIGMVATNAAALLVATSLLDVGVVGVFGIFLAVRAVFGLLGLLFCRSWLAWPDGLGHLPRLLRFAVPFGIIGGVGTFVPTLERWMVRSLLGEAQLGLYAVGATVALAMMLPVQAFQTAWGPFSVAIHREADAGRTYNQIARAFTSLAALTALALVTLSPLLVRLLASERYAGAAAVVLPLVLGLTVQGVGWVTEIGIGLSLRSHLQLFGYAAFLLAATGGILVLARPLGIAGVALGVAVGHLAKALVNSWLAQTAHPIPWPYGRMALMVAATTLAGAVQRYAHVRHGTFTGLATGAAGLLALAALAWRGLFEPHERRRVVGLLRRAGPWSGGRTE